MKKLWNSYLRIWEKQTGWKLLLCYVVHYTVLFAILWPVIFSSFSVADKSYIAYPDPMSQMFSREVYLSQTIRDGIQTLLNGEGWTFPMYDFRLGFVKSDLQVEPVEWLTALWPWDQIDILFDFLVVLRIYLIGVSFSAFGFYFKQKPLPVLIGAISYCFGTYSLAGGLWHPFFLTPLMLLPLLIIGTEKIIRRESPLVLVAAVFLSLISNLYFSCMSALVTMLYAFVRLWFVCKEKGIKKGLGILGRLAVGVVTGIALSGIVMLPTLIQVLGTGRIGRDVTAYTNFLSYGKTYISKFLTQFALIPQQVGSDTTLGFSVLAIPAVLMLFLRRKKEERVLRWMFFVLTAMLMLPIVGYIMSGFNTITNRWCFAYAFCCAAIIMFELPHFLEADRRTIAHIGTGGAIYFLICRFVLDPNDYSEAPFVMLAVTMLVILLLYAGGEKTRRMTLAVCLLITCVSVRYSAYLIFDPQQGGRVSRYEAKGMPYEWYDKSQYSSLSRCNAVKNDKSFYGVLGDSITVREANASFYFDLRGSAFFSSLRYMSIMDWYQEMESATTGQNISNYGIISRAPMMTLSNVKYYAHRSSSNYAIPYGFQQIDRINGEQFTDTIFENSYALPVGYTYDSYLPNSEYEALTALEKQEAQLQTVVLKNTPASIEAASPELQVRQLPVEILEAKNMTWKDGKLNVTEANATMTLAFAGLPNSETYLRVVNLDLTDGNSTRRWILWATANEVRTPAYFYADAYTYGHGMKTQALDLGYSEDGYTTVTLTFPQKGTFILDDLQIWCQPMDHYGEQINALREEPLENVETNWRGLTGTISVSKDKILCLSIPYDEGWSAYVDGKKVELLQANTAFMAVELEAGEHTVELKYWTPGLTGGIVLTVAGTIGLIAMIWYWRKKAGQGVKE